MPCVKHGELANATIGGMNAPHTRSSRTSESSIARMCDTLLREFEPLQMVLFGALAAGT